jgi:hypothetical protein
MAPAATTSNTVIAPVRFGVGRRGQDGSGLPTGIHGQLMEITTGST